MVVMALGQRLPHIVGDNGIRPGTFVTAIRPHHAVCMGLGSSSSPPDAVQITVGAGPGGPQPLTLSFPGTRLRTRVDDYADGPVAIRLPDDRPASAGIACLRNAGAHPVQIAGEPGSGATVRGKPQSFGISFVLLADDPPTWWSHVSATLGRVGAARGGAGGPATGWIVLLLAGAIVAAALAAAARWAR